MKEGQLRSSKIKTMANSQKFRDNYDEIFMKQKKKTPKPKKRYISKF